MEMNVSHGNGGYASKQLAASLYYIILYPPINALGISVGVKMIANKFKSQNPT
jgi:hypothetical protein